MPVFMLAKGICMYIWDLKNLFFSYSNYKAIIEEYNKLFEEHLSSKFVVNNLQLIHIAKGKFDYIISRNKRNE